MEWRSLSVNVNFCICFIFLIHPPVIAWDNEDLELFDLYEEVNRNFYDVLGVSKDAGSSEIRRAYHKLSRVLHPDKNKDGSEQDFRQLVGIYEVLKDESKRRKYDQILERGLPDWRQPVFYYRHVRKLGLLEILILIFSIATVAQYLFVWSVYWERKYALEEVFMSRLRKKKKLKKNKPSETIEENKAIVAEKISNIPRPRWQDLIPFQLVCLIHKGIICLPQTLPYFKAKFVNWQQRRLQSEVVEEEEVQSEVRKPRKKAYIPPSYVPCQYEEENQEVNQERLEKSVSFPERSQTFDSAEQRDFCEWTGEELSTLAKAMKKYPTGTFERWEKIASILLRSPREVALVAHQAKLNFTGEPKRLAFKDDLVQKQLGSDDKNAVNYTASCRTTISYDQTDDCNGSTVLPKSKIIAITNKQIKEGKNGAEATMRTSDNQMVLTNDVWTQVQQRSLELALQQFPKGKEDRWDKIAECVPGKSKEECMQRYKLLVDLVRKKKEGT